MNKQIGSYSFRHICTLQPETELGGTIRILMPQVAYVNRSNLPLHAYGTGPFCKFVISKDVHEAGVYVLTVEAEVKYVGECISLTKRYNTGYGQISPRKCYKGGQSTNCRVNNLIYQLSLEGKQIDLWFMATQRYKDVERELLSQLNPGWNCKGVTR